MIIKQVYSVSQKIPPKIFWHFFPNGWEFLVKILHAYYTFLSTLDNVFIQLTATLMKLCHIKRDHPVHIIMLKMSTSCRNARWNKSDANRANATLRSEWHAGLHLEWTP